LIASQTVAFPSQLPMHREAEQRSQSLKLRALPAFDPRTRSTFALGKELESRSKAMAIK